jgi:hypothetical protein
VHPALSATTDALQEVHATDEQLNGCYGDVKAAFAPAYLGAWAALRQPPSVFAAWIPKPAHHLQFGAVEDAAATAAAAVREAQ